MPVSRAEALRKVLGTLFKFGKRNDWSELVSFFVRKLLYNTF